MEMKSFKQRRPSFIIEVGFSDHPCAAQETATLVCPRPARPAVAANARSLRHLDFRSDAAANAGGRGDPLLSAVPRTLPRRCIAGAGSGAGTARVVERPGLLFARAQSAKGRWADSRSRGLPERL